MRSDSPRYLDARVADDTLKKVHLVSVAAALASMVCRVAVRVLRGRGAFVSERRQICLLSARSHR